MREGRISPIPRATCPTLTVAAEGDLSLLPSERRWTVELANVLPVPVRCQADGQAVEATASYDEEKHLLRIELPVCPVGAKLTLTFPEGLQRDDRAPLDAAIGSSTMRKCRWMISRGSTMP